MHLSVVIFQLDSIRGGVYLPDSDVVLRQRAAPGPHELHLPRHLHRRRELPARRHQQHVRRHCGTFILITIGIRFIFYCFVKIVKKIKRDEIFLFFCTFF